MSLAKSPISLRANIALFAICLAVSLALQLPGNVPFDGITVWYEAKNRILFAQHPPAMVLLWWISNLIAPGPAPFTTLQIVTLWLPVFFAVDRTRPKLWLAVATYAAFLLCPLVFAMSGKIGKDIIGGHLAVLAFVLVLPRGKTPTTATRWGIALALATLAAMIRYQLGVIFPALLILWWLERRQQPQNSNRNLLIGTSAALATFALISVGILMVFVHQGPSDIQQSFRKIFIYDIAGVVYNDPNATLPEFASSGVNEAVLARKIRLEYDTSRVDTLWQPGGAFDDLQRVSDDSVWHQWLYSLAHGPSAMLKHRFLTFARVLGIGDVYGCWPVYAGISKIPKDRAADVKAQSYGRSISATVVKARYFPAGSILFRAWAYCLVGGVIIALALSRQYFSQEAALLSGAGILYELSFMLLPQACDVRYSYFTMLAVMFSFFILLFANSNPNKRATKT